MANHKKGQTYGGVPIGECSPYQILHHAIVLILPSAVISMKKHYLLTKPMCFVEEVQTANHIVGTFATLSSLVSKEIDLTWQGFTVHSEHGALSWCQKVDRPWLEWIRWKMHLLCIVKAVVDLYIPCIWRGGG